MCGICGIINFDKSSHRDEVNIKKMNDRLQSRGPDAKKIWFSDNKKTLLGHTRLSIIDPTEFSNQPFYDKENKIVITYNGELYNYKDLRNDLIKLGYIFNTSSDTEVIVKLYIHYKENMLKKMTGMFAFCIYDIKKNEFFLARDHYGIKPLYYFKDNQKFIFSSQVKSLIECDYIVKDVSPAAACSFLINGSVMEPFTMYKNVHALDSGTYIKIKDNKLFKSEYYNLAEHILQVKSDLNNKSYFDINLSDSLNNSIKRHLVSDVPIVLFLSSGIDSTSILNSISNVSKKKINTITMGFDVYKNTNLDEVTQAKIIKKNYKTNSNFTYRDRDTFFKIKDDILNSMDQPSIDGINTYMVSNLAKTLGFKVAISGIGGDELFSGYPTFKHVPRMKKIYDKTFFSESFSKLYKKYTTNFFDLLNLKKLSYFYEFSNSYMGAYTLRRSLFMPDELYSFLPSKFINDGLEEFNQKLIDESNLLAIDDDISKVIYLEFNNYLKNQLLKDADWAGMANSVEIRVPFIDKEFIDACLHLNLKQNINKDLLVNTVKKPVKNLLLNIPKKGFMVPVSDWIGSNKNSYHNWAKEIILNYDI